MIEVKIGDLLDSEAQTLVNTVNCVGIMGKGIALQFKERFLEMFKDYEARCRDGKVQLGKPYLWKSLVPPGVLNFPTKDHWRSVTRLSDIEEGLRHLLRNYEAWGIKSIAVPPLGCGLGQLEWRIVGPTLFRYLSKMTIPVELYAPYGTPHEELTPRFLAGDSAAPSEPGKMPHPEWVRPGWVALVDILQRIEAQPYHWPVGRVIFQKVAYVATAEGIATGLEYRRAPYGPFTSGLKQIESRMVNNGLISVERRGKHMHEFRVGPTFPDARKAYAADLEKLGPTLDRVADLFLRMNTDQAEVAATVHFATQELRAKGGARPSERAVLDAVLRWKVRRKPPLDPQTVALAIRHLAALRWLDVSASADLPLPQEELADV